MLERSKHLLIGGYVIAQMADKHVTLMRGKVGGIIAPSFTLGAANRCRWVFGFT